MRSLVQRNSSLAPKEIDDVIWGCVMQREEQGFNLARNSLLLAGCPTASPARPSIACAALLCRRCIRRPPTLKPGWARCIWWVALEHMGHIDMNQAI